MTRVLVFSRDASWYGGVVNFIALLRKNFSSDIDYTQFMVGQRKGAWGRLSRVLQPLWDAVSLFKLLMLDHFDAYHVNPSLNYSSIARDGLFLLVLRLVRAENVIVSFHGWDTLVEKKIERSPLLRWSFLKVYGYASNTLVLSQGFKEWLVSVGFPERNVHLFTTMFDGDEFSREKAERQGMGIHILFLSRLVREKGIYELLEAFEQLHREFPSLKLIIAGNGPEEDGIAAFVKDRGLESEVNLVGYVRDEEKVRTFLRSDMFVFPTYYGEGCPVSLLEAMAAGLPVVTTSAGGIPHIVNDGENGIILESVTVDSVRDAMRRLLIDDSLRKGMEAKNLKDAWGKYNAPVVTKLFESFYRGEYGGGLES